MNLIVRDGIDLEVGLFNDCQVFIGIVYLVVMLDMDLNSVVGDIRYVLVEMLVVIYDVGGDGVLGVIFVSRVF